MSEAYGAAIASAGVSRSILLIDDDAELTGLMSDFFREQDFMLEAAPNGQSGLARALEENFDLILLDVMMPIVDGFEVLRQVRRRSMVPIIMLTARTSQGDRVTGLDLGADDYLPKPFDPQELLARIRAVLRRTGQRVCMKQSVVEVGSLRVNPQSREAWTRDAPLEVTTVEFDVLDLLARSAGRVVTRDELSTVLYQRLASPYERSLDVHVCHLRKKLEGSGVAIRCVRGVGYVLAEAEAV